MVLFHSQFSGKRMCIVVIGAIPFLSDIRNYEMNHVLY